MQSWQQIVELAEHYRAIDQYSIYLDSKQADYPWHYVTKVECSSSVYELNGNSHVYFTATHGCGLEFKWVLELVDGWGEDAKLNIEGITIAINNLPRNSLYEFKELIRQMVEATTKKTYEYMTTWQTLLGRAAMLQAIIESPRP